MTTEERLLALVDQLDLLINGTAEQKVPTDNGLVPTVAALMQTIKSFRHSLRVIDYRNLNALNLDALADKLVAGNLYRVFGDTDRTLNGLYRVDEDDLRLLIKTDMYDIIDIVNPAITNGIVEKTFYGLGPHLVHRWRLDKSQTDTFVQNLDVGMIIYANEIGQRRVTSTDLKLQFIYNEALTPRIQSILSVADTLTQPIDDLSLPTASFIPSVVVRDTNNPGIVEIDLSLTYVNGSNSNLTNHKIDLKVAGLKQSRYAL